MHLQFVRAPILFLRRSNWLKLLPAIAAFGAFHLIGKTVGAEIPVITSVARFSPDASRKY